MEKTYKITKLVVCIILMVASLGAALYFAIIPFVNVSTAYNIKAPTSIEIYENGSVKKHINSTDASFNEIMKLYEEAFSVSKSDIVFGSETIKDTKIETSKKLDNSKGIYMVFVYAPTNQTLTEGYTNIIYDSITMQITDTTSVEPAFAYIVNKNEDSPSKGATFKYTSYAKQHKLYNYLTDLI